LDRCHVVAGAVHDDNRSETPRSGADLVTSLSEPRQDGDGRAATTGRARAGIATTSEGGHTARERRTISGRLAHLVRCGWSQVTTR
jgi:hypothetical protein